MANIDYIKTAKMIADTSKKMSETAVDGVQKGVFSPSRGQAVGSMVGGAVIAIACTALFGIVGAIAAWGLFGLFILGVEHFQENASKESASSSQSVPFMENVAHAATARLAKHHVGNDIIRS